jgi:hypothetical protein
MKLIKPLIYLMALIILTACVHGTGSVTRSDSANLYSVSAQYGSLGGSWDRASREAIEKATAYCTNMGKKYNFISEQRSGVWGWTPQESTINFTCGEPPAEFKQFKVD